ncbi:glycosyltransferase family 4 protein [uncultured Thiodictyon sp.]|uniref:glycosyltransferase family 4 protein n=1 Tax=uncultured Thiodictyon sp. TaxID=1846217 RepID=UPI0025D06E2B|nr:glycosyltransferase family 4 protein [uncultured Thiodictyon sp.]
MINATTHIPTKAGVHADLSSTTILIVSLYYWPEPAGSAPPVQQMAECLAQLGVKVSVLTARPAYPEMRVYANYRDNSRDQEEHQAVAITRIPVASYQPGGGLMTRLNTELNFAVRAWWKLLRMPRPACLVLVSPSILTVAAGVLGSPRSARRIAIIHDIQSGLAKSLKMTHLPGITTLMGWFERHTLNRMQRIVTLSQAMADAILSLGVTPPISIIPPTVDDRLIRPLPERPGVFTLLYSGNIGRKQGLAQLVDLAERLRHRQLDVAIIIRGDGNYRDELQQQVMNRGLGNIRLEPLRPAAQLSEGLADGHIHLVPQNPVGAAFAVPSKIYSIMAAGRPFICTADAGSSLDTLREASDAFVICPPNQPDRFADTLECLINDPNERSRLGRNGRAYVEQHAGKSACSRAYQAVLFDY